MIFNQKYDRKGGERFISIGSAFSSNTLKTEEERSDDEEKVVCHFTGRCIFSSRIVFLGLRQGGS